MNTNNRQNSGMEENEFWNDDLMWDNIEKGLDKKEDNRFGFWLFLGFIILCFTSTIIYTKSKPSDRNLLSHTDTSTSERKNKLSLSENEMANIDNITESIVKNDTRLDNEIISNKSKKRSITKQSMSQYKPIINDQEQNDLIIINDQYKDNKDTLSKAINTILQENISKFSRIKNNKKNNILIKPLPQLANINLNNSFLDTTPIISLDLYENIEPLDLKENHKTNAPQGSCLLLYTSLGKLNMNNSIDQDNAWMNEKNLSEDPMYAIDLGIEFHTPIYKELYVSIGAEYSRRVYNVEISDTIIETTTMMNDSAIIVNGIEPLYLSGEITSKKNIITDYNVYNKYNLISIPVSIGLKKQFQHNILSLSVGTAVNLYARTDGYSLSPALRVVPYSELKPDIDHTLIDRMTISAGYSRQVSHKWSINCGMRWNKSIKTIYSISSPNAESLKRRHEIISISLGTGFHF